MVPSASLWEETCAERVETQPLADGLTVDLVIVGGGFTGTAAALTAAEAGASVCLIEAQRIGHGGSGRNVGLANAGLWTPPDAINRLLGPAAGDRLVAVLASAPDRVFDLIRRHDIACEPVRAGTLHCAHAPSGMAELRDRHAQQQARGAPVTLLEAADAQARTGSPAVHGALHDARAGTVQPLAYCRGLARAAAGFGARLVAGAAVTGLRHRDGAWRVDTAGGSVTGRRLLLATNAYSGGIAAPAGPSFVPVHYFQLATQPLSPDRLATILPGREGCWDTAPVMSSFRLDAAGRLLVGGIGNLDGAAGGIHAAWAARHLARLYPQLAGTPLHHAWGGRIAMTATHLPQILRLGPDGLACFGYSGRGIGPGTVFGSLAATALLRADESVLPLVPIDQYAERWAGPLAAWYETGAAVTHLVSARWPARPAEAAMPAGAPAPKP